MKKKLCFLLVILFFSLSVFSASLVKLTDSAKTLGATYFWDPLTDSGMIQKNGHTISFILNQNIALLDYKTLKIIEKPILQNGVLFVDKDFITMAEELFRTYNNDTYFKIGAILIDPGHGGKDPGTIGTITKNGKKVSLNEKDIVLSVSKDLHKMLSEKYPDKKVLLTRSTDVFLTLEQRVEIANSVKLDPHEAIVYVSVHANSAFDKKASGFEVWYLSPGYRRNVLTEKDVDADLLPILNSMMEEEYTTESILIAKFINDGIENQVGNYTKSRGLKEEEWFVVRNANMPSVLVELGFVSNPTEAELLYDKNYLRKLALGIYNGIGSFVTHFEQSRGFTSSQ